MLSTSTARCRGWLAHLYSSAAPCHEVDESYLTFRLFSEYLGDTNRENALETPLLVGRPELSCRRPEHFAVIVGMHQLTV